MPDGSVANTKNPILIVEDDEDLLKNLEHLVIQADCEPTVARNGVEALEYLEKKEFDAILSDLIMPETSGLDFLKNVRKKNIQTPFLILTGFDDNEKVLEALRLGAWDFITKPYNPHELERILLRAVDTGRRIREIREKLRLPKEMHTPDMFKQIERDQKFITLTSLVNNTQRTQKK